MVAAWEHERLHAYGRVREATRAIERVARRLPSDRPDLRDQLRRAAASIALNLAEGAAEFRRPEKARFYRIARRSAAECAAALDIVEDISDDVVDLGEARERLGEAGALLLALIRSIEKEARSVPSSQVPSPSQER